VVYSGYTTDRMSLVRAAVVVTLSITFLYATVTTTFLLVLATLLIWRMSRRPVGIPPGPPGVPILGSIPFIGSNPEETFNQLKKKYGPIMSVYLGTELAIVLNDFTTMKAALIDEGEIFSGRMFKQEAAIHPSDRKSILSTYGQFWKEHRRFALSTLRDFGVGKSSIEPAIQNEMYYFLQEIEQKNNEPFDISYTLTASVCNNISLIEFGRRFEYNDPKFIKLEELIRETFRLSGTTGIHIFFPWLRRIPGMDKIGELDKNISTVQALVDFMREEMKKHKDTHQEGSKDDYINAYYTERALREKSGVYPEYFCDESLETNLDLLFLAGTDTTATTLRWGFLFMIIHPDIQAKVQKELDDVIGRDRMPSHDDKGNLPYTEATLLEIQRKGSVVPLSIPHTNIKEVNLNGHRIPNGTLILPNIYAVHHDEKLFPDPMSFRPERFINEKGQVVKPEHLIPFSMGKRFCVGEPLARMELFVYFTSVLHKFTLKSPEGEVPTLDAVSSVVRAPKPYRVVASLR